VDGILVPALVIFALLQDHITRGITQGAVKG
jgi:ABC-type glycerol-3-phosphate transport system permease component